MWIARLGWFDRSSFCGLSSAARVLRFVFVPVVYCLHSFGVLFAWMDFVGLVLWSIVRVRF